MSGAPNRLPEAPASADARPRRGWKRIALVAALCAVGLGGGILYWRTPPHLTQSRVALPTLPDLAGKPAALRERLEKANAAATAPNPTPEAVAELGRLYHENGYLDEAAACWQWLHAAQPRDAKWCYYLADLRRTAGDYAGDEALLNETAQLAPDYAPAWLQLAQLQFKSGRLDQAHQSYERRLSLVPGDPYARLGLARIALQEDRRSDARKMLEQLVHDAPKFPPSLNLYAEMLANDGDQEGAEKQRLRAADAGRFRDADDPWMDELHAWCFDPNRLAVLGTIDTQTNFGDLGRHYLERAMTLAPTNRDCAKALSGLYLKLHDTEAARVLLERTLPLITPPDPVLDTNLCEAYRLEHRFDEALAIVDRQVAQMPNSYELHNERGAILGDLGRLEESVAAYRKAVALSPTDTDSNYSLGITLLALGRRDEGITYVKRSLTLQPTYPKALITLGRVELDAGNLDAAAKYAKLIYDLHPEQYLARQLMAAWYLRAGLLAAKNNDAAAAEEDFRTGFGIDDKNATLGMNLGTTYLMQGRAAEAIPPLESFHRGAPKNAQSALFLGQAYAQTGRIEDARRLLQEGEALARQSGDTTTAGYCHEILSRL